MLPRQTLSTILYLIFKNNLFTLGRSSFKSPHLGADLEERKELEMFAKLGSFSGNHMRKPQYGVFRNHFCQLL